jgi:outer membrane lipoprotein carrier protein
MKMKFLVASLLFVAAAGAQAQSAVDTLKAFVRDVKTGRAEFTQTVTSPDGTKKKNSSGRFEFSRPNHFRFTYQKPFEQTIVADGQKVWIYDADLNQASSRKFSTALGATPAALLAGGSLDKDFDLAAQAAKDGLDWVEATPKAKDGSFKSVRVGFKGKTLASVEVVDAFGQRSLLQFSQFVANEAIKPETFVFTVPKGADVIEQ